MKFPDVGYLVWKKYDFDIKNNRIGLKKGVKVALELFSEYLSPRPKNGVRLLTPRYVLIATNFAVATCFSEFAFYRRFLRF